MDKGRNPIKHPVDDVPEASFPWHRKRFPTKLPNEEDRRIEQDAELETDRDLCKPIPQLLCDFHDQAERALRDCRVNPETKLLLNAQKRMVAMMAQAAIKHEEVSVQTMNLTERIIKLTHWLIGLTVFLAIVSVIALFRCETISKFF